MTTNTITERLAGGGGPRRRIIAAAGAIIVIAIAIAIIVGADPGSSKGQNAASTATGATTVQRRDLVETDTESGTLGYANQQTIYNRMSGTITYLPSVGAVIKPGGTLFTVDGHPVVLFNGSYPAFRDLTSSDSDGRDILQLNADLKAMGFDPNNEITVDNAWQTGTTDAVERWQASHGATQTGTITLGQIVFLPGPQLINTVDATLGSTGGGGASSGSGGSATGASATINPTSTATRTSYHPVVGQHPEFVDLTTSSAPATAGATVAGPRATCPNLPTTTTTTTTPAPDCPGTTTTPTMTTPTTPPTTGQSTGTLEAIVKLLETQNKLLAFELLAAKKSAAAAQKSGSGAGAGAGAAAGSASGGGGGGGGGGSASSGGASSGGASGGSASSGGGSGSGSSGAGSSATPILVSSSTELVVTVDLDATKQNEAKLHEPVTVQLPDGSTVNGRITAVSPVAQSSSSSSGSGSGGGGSGGGSGSGGTPSATIPVTISLQKHLDASALDQAAVSVNFAQAVANNVLSVPVTSLLATQGGGYAVQEASPPHKLIRVTPGLFAAGYVQISGPGIQDGMQVTDSQG